MSICSASTRAFVHTPPTRAEPARSFTSNGLATVVMHLGWFAQSNPKCKNVKADAEVITDFPTLDQQVAPSGQILVK